MRSFVEIRLQVTGFHCWSDAPPDVEFLKDLHRHTFHIRMRFEVSHNDRDVEFVQVKRRVLTYIDETFSKVPKTQEYLFNGRSCEMIAMELMMWWNGLGPQARCVEIGVSEDNEFEGIATDVR